MIAIRPDLAATTTVAAIFGVPADRRHLYATTDAGGIYEMVASTDAGVIVRGRRTGTLARIVQTGRVARNGEVRVRFEFARDLGDLAGTLAFDADHCGGRAPLQVFA